jgi:hypothetical protein
MTALARAIERFAQTDGDHTTAIPALTLHRRKAPTEPLHCIYNLGVPRWDSRAGQMAQPVVSTSAPPRCLDGGDVDLLHRHHRLEGTLCLTATSRKRLG